MTQTVFTGIVFLVAYALIISDRIDRTVCALGGAVALILGGVLPQNEAFLAVDFNVIFLLVGMMLIANVMSDTGVFQWIAVQSVRAGHGNPFAILVILSLVTAVVSAFLDNVTIVVLIAPVTLFVAARLGVSPVPFLVAEIFAANIGGAATLIGDPPNILIGSAANYDFLTFAANMLPIVIVCLLALIGGLAWRFRPEVGMGRVTVELDASGLITDRPLLRKSLVVMALVLVGFVLHGALHLEPATIALAGAMLLLSWSGKKCHPCFREVEWTTLFFFVGLFILVEGLVKVGIIEWIATHILALTQSNVRLTSTAILWLSALLSGVIDNIPYTATMIPIIETLGRAMPADPLWWALAMGADFGGNLTLVGASANVVVAAVAERAGYPIGFKRFLSYSLVTSGGVLLLSTAYLWLRYLL